MGMCNRENVNPNLGQYAPEQYQDPPLLLFHPMEQQNNAFTVTQNNQQLTQLMEKMQAMQNIIDGLTLTNPNRG